MFIHAVSLTRILSARAKSNASADVNDAAASTETGYVTRSICSAAEFQETKYLMQIY